MSCASGRRFCSVLATIAVMLALAAGLGGCPVGHEVTERDVEVARQMDAPGEVMESLEAGRWPSDLARYKVRNAEACIDYMEARYGYTFSAVSATGGAKWMTHEDDVVLRVEDGPFAGELVKMAYDSGVRDGRQAMDPVFMEDFFHTVNHAEWERIASEAALPLLAGLPEGSWYADIRMHRTLYHQEQIDRPITQGGGYGDVLVYVDVDASGLSEADMEELLEELNAALDATGLRGSTSLAGHRGAEAAEAIASGEMPPYATEIWYGSLPYGVEGGGR